MGKEHSEPTSVVVLQGGPQGTTIVNHRDIPVSSVVMSGFATTEILDLAALYCCAKVLDKNSYAEGEGMSLRWKKFVKGKKGGCFNAHTAMFDICVGGSHRHSKVSSNSNVFSITGAKSFSEGTVLFKYVLQQCRDAQAYLLSTKTPSWNAAMDWLIGATKGDPSRATYYTTVKSKDFGTICVCKDVDEHTLVWPESYPIIHQTHILEFLARSDDLRKTGKYHRGLVERIESIRAATHIYKGELEFDTVKLTANIYYYNLGFEPDRQKLNSYLRSKNYNSDFPPIWGKTVKVIIPSKKPLDPAKFHRKNMSGDQKLVFYPHGSIRHNTSRQEDAEECFYQLMKVIIEGKSLFAL